MTRANDFSANSAGPIGTRYQLDDGTFRFGPACLVSFPSADPVAEMTTEEFMAALFG